MEWFLYLIVTIIVYNYFNFDVLIKLFICTYIYYNDIACSYMYILHVILLSSCDVVMVTMHAYTIIIQLYIIVS